MKTVEENGLLSDSQVGFRPGYGCRDAIMIANTLVEKGLNLGFEDMRLMFVDIKVCYNYEETKTICSHLFNAI